MADGHKACCGGGQEMNNRDKSFRYFISLGDGVRKITAPCSSFQPLGSDRLLKCLPVCRAVKSGGAQGSAGKFVYLEHSGPPEMPDCS